MATPSPNLLDHELDRLILSNGNALGSVVRATPSNANPIQAWLLGQDWDKAGRVAGKEYKTSVWVYACLNVWTQVAQVPFVLRSSDGKGDLMDIKTGPLYGLMKSPNSRDTPGEWFTYAILDLGLYGEYFWLWNGGGSTNRESIPLFLHRVSPKSMEIRKEDLTSSGELFQWTRVLRRGGFKEKIQKIPVNSVIHGKLPNPYDANRGLSPLEALRVTVDADYAARIHNRSQMRNRGRIEGVVTYNPDMTDEDRVEDYKKVWDEKFGGQRSGDNVGNWVHSAGISDIKQLSQSMKDLDWLEGQRLGREEVCAAYGVPPVVVGILDRATYTNYDQALLAVWTETLIPMGDNISARFQKDLVDPFEQPNVTAMFDYLKGVPVLRENRMEKIKDYISLVNTGRLSPIMAAEMVDLNIGPTTQIHEEVLVPFNLVPSDVLLEGGQAVSGPATPVGEPLTPEAGDDPASPKPSEKPIAQSVSDGRLEFLIDEVAEMKAEMTRSVEEGVIKGTEELRTAIWKAHMRERDGFERQFRATLKKFFMEQRKDVLANIEAFRGKELRAIETKATLGERLLAAIFVVEGWTARLAVVARKVLDNAFTTGAEGVLQELDLSLDDIVPVEVWRKQQDFLMRKVNETTRDRLQSVREVLEAGIAAGDPEDVIANKMKEAARGVFRDRESDRHRIARTEVNRAFNGARFEQMKQAGVSQMEWLTSKDSNVRETHVGLDGQTRLLGTPFGNGLLYPLDPGGSAKETVNCRCIAVAKTGG